LSGNGLKFWVPKTGEMQYRCCCITTA